MTRNRIVGAFGALTLLAVPAAAVAHGDGHHHGKKPHKHHGKKHPREVTGKATATIASFANGELTLALPSGKTYTADVTKRTVIICRSLPATAKASGHGSGAGRDGKHGDGDGTTTAPASTSAPASTTVPGTTTPPSGHAHGRCGTEALVAGAKVSSAKLSLKGDAVIWKKVAVVK
jgi:hypothetical protein